jgi:hypothetical protein
MWKSCEGMVVCGVARVYGVRSCGVWLVLALRCVGSLIASPLWQPQWHSRRQRGRRGDTRDTRRTFDRHRDGTCVDEGPGGHPGPFVCSCEWCSLCSVPSSLYGSVPLLLTSVLSSAAMGLCGATALFAFALVALFPSGSAQYPLLNNAAPAESLTAYRTRLRTYATNTAAPAAPASFFAANELTANGFQYTLAVDGRVDRVVGFVSTTATAKAFADSVSTLFDRYCESLVTRTNAPLMHLNRPPTCGASQTPQFANILGQQLDKGHLRMGNSNQSHNVG